ncbi:DeoR/GlpR family DNA-binding transcription regulator [Aquabacterium sp. A7-Y]|uniref:DeoR/GlpR family DNA-binding transcription regulator n=1 Tax=Aquabacterium sp. A7-Y TaxID=1349605 RepID=UPI00223D0053|nr:DeoR/GlpR family DNA-binding transcription regulator [Aquabacterium sp. A7-Y]MCW7540604.1 DeoR/GlpR family DNA-binding transcription regulator [Aquabacterium sp. A7-Y]
MLTEQRKQHILAVLRRDGRVLAKALGQELGVSEDTIRRDLRELARTGQLQRVHGGALPASPATATLAVREGLQVEEKRALGRAGARLIQPGQLVFVDGGTTTLQLVRHLPEHLKATIVTHSPLIAAELGAHPNVEVVLIGGRLFKHSMVSVGSAAVEAISRIRADLYLMGVTGLHAETGLSTGDLEEAYIKRALLAQAAETVVLASSDKLGVASAYSIAPATAATVILATRQADPAALAPFRRLKIAVQLADQGLTSATGGL